MIPGLTADQHVLHTEQGDAVAARYAWSGGQYCALHTPRGIIGCGLYDVACADHFGMALAIARGTPDHPLRTGEDLLTAKIVGVSHRATELGIEIGMTGLEALGRLLAPVEAA